MKRRILILNVLIACGCARSDGVPLQSFAAKDRAYFPAFIEGYFEAAKKYQQKFPTLEEASSEVRVVQVKRLSGASTEASNESNLAWSADGVYLSYELVDGKSRRIQVKSLEGDYQRDLLVVPKGSSNFLDGMVSRSIQSYNAGLSWSKDSTRFAFMSNGGLGVYNIFVGAVGAKEEPIVASNAKDGYASWGPNSDMLSFVSSRTGAGDIYLYTLNNENLTRLTNSDEVDLFPVWSPDGNAIVYSSGDQDNHDVMIVRKQDGKWRPAERVTRWEQDDLRPTFSPNGKLIAFYSSEPAARGERWNIHVVDAKETQLGHGTLRSRVVANDVVVDLNTGPAWSPDGRKIFYVKREPERNNPIYAYDLFSGRRYRLNTGTSMNRDILMSSLGVLSFRAQVGAWDRVFIALTNQGMQLQGVEQSISKIHFGRL